MATIEKNMLLLKRLYHFSRKLDVVGRTYDCRFMATRVRRRYDPLSLFMVKDVQRLLQRLTGDNLDKTYRANNKVDVAQNPLYLVLTKEELEKELKRDKWRATHLLRMPPFMEVREPRDSLLSDDPDIAPAIKHKMVFVDISTNPKRIKGYNDRPIVVRHTNGQLTNADWDTYDRMCQIFDPKPKRSLYMPKMFEPDQLEAILGETDYVYLLERACLQFEPDSADFIRVTRRVYEHISKQKEYDRLRSTRFFGHMTFYFCWVDKIEGLLQDMIQRELINDAAALINLRQLVSRKNLYEGDNLTIVKNFIKTEAVQSNKETLTNAVKNYVHIVEQREWQEFASEP